MKTGINVEDRVKAVFQKVLDIEPEEINATAPLDKSLGIDSTELVEISVGLKKELGIPLKDNELKKTHSFNEIMDIIKSKSEADHCGPSCGCSH